MVRLKWLAISSMPLRVMLTVPYVLLVLLAALVIGALSYQAGREAVDSLSDYVLSETVGRIAQAVDKHIAGSEAVLETAFPKGMAAPPTIAQGMDELRTRFWLATTVHRDPNNYAYYGDRLGHFFGLWRYSDVDAELRLRTDASAPRSVYRFSGIHGPLRSPMVESALFDPRARPWFRAGQGADAQTWTAIYIDFKTLQLVATRARKVNDAAGDFQGVVATDLSLQRLNDFLKTLKLSPNGFAFIVERDGNLVATSRGPHLRKGPGENNTRLNAADNTDKTMAATYASVRRLVADGPGKGRRGTTWFETPEAGAVQVGFAQLKDDAGLDWTVAVGVPRADFMQQVTDNAWRTAAMALLACALIVAIGTWVLHRVAAELRALALAARQVGEGRLDVRIPVDRRDEIGELARSFADMQARLYTDRLTGIANREAAVRRVEDRIIRHRRSGDGHPFALMFVDLNGFKQVNDRFGHDVGDHFLVEMSRRMAAVLRHEDMVARYGGDEFVVLLDSLGQRGHAEAVRQKLEQVLAQPVVLPGLSAADMAGIGTGGAIGVALCPQDGHDFETLMRHADAQMYERKAAHKSQAGPAAA